MAFLEKNLAKSHKQDLSILEKIRYMKTKLLSMCIYYITMESYKKALFGGKLCQLARSTRVHGEFSNKKKSSFKLNR
jgi:hypothetical protein